MTTVPNDWLRGLTVGTLLGEVERDPYLAFKFFPYHQAGPLATGRVVLDVGCELGLGSHHLARVARSVIGVDASSAWVDAAQSLAPEPGTKVGFRVADACALPFGDGAFDLVVAFNLLEHVPEPARAASECLRVLSDGGRLMFTLPGRGLSVEDDTTLQPAEGLDAVVPLVTALLPGVTVIERAFGDSQSAPSYRVFTFQALKPRF